MEMIGTTSCICFDKTGTLTTNRMSVSQLYLNRQFVKADINMESYRKKINRCHEIDSSLANHVHKPEYTQSDALFMQLVKSMALSTKAEFRNDRSSRIDENFLKLKVHGDESEAALIRFLTPVIMSEYGGDVIASG